jgi:hypothetical protein
VTGRTHHPLRRWGLALAAAFAAVGAAAASVGAQANCTVNNQATCTAGGTGTTAITITISTVARLTSPSGSLTLPTPDINQFNAGFGTPLSVALSVRANTTWALSIRGSSNLWTAAPASAWQAKPVGDLQWATNIAGPYTNMTTVLAPLANGAATAAAAPPLFLRGRFAWAQDTPGNYSIGVQVVLTAP